MCVPEALGGGGFGHLAYYAAWQALYSTIAGRKIGSCLLASAHWVLGLISYLSCVTDEALARVMPGLLDGSKSMFSII